MGKVSVLLSKEELSQQMAKLSKGRGGLLIVPMAWWKMIADAYDSPLIRRVTDVSMPASPVMEVETKELKFRVGIEPQ